MRKITSEEARNYIKTLPVMRKRNLKEVFENVNPDGKILFSFLSSTFF